MTASAPAVSSAAVQSRRKDPGRGGHLRPIYGNIQNFSLSSRALSVRSGLPSENFHLETVQMAVLCRDSPTTSTISRGVYIERRGGKLTVSARFSVENEQWNSGQFDQNDGQMLMAIRFCTGGQ